MLIHENNQRAIAIYNKITNTKNGNKVLDILVNNSIVGVSLEDLENAMTIIANEKIDVFDFIIDYKEWKKYIKTNPKCNESVLNYDTYQSFIDKIDKAKVDCLHINPIFNANEVFIGEVNTFDEAKRLPIPFQNRIWCICDKNFRFNEHKTNGEKYLLIVYDKNSYPYQYIMAVINNGTIIYWNTNDLPMSLENDDRAKLYKMYENTLPNEALTLLHKLANINEGNNYGGIDTIYEAKVHIIVREVINEMLYNEKSLLN